MDLMEISEKYKMSREEAAKVLHEIADSLGMAIDWRMPV